MLILKSLTTIASKPTQIPTPSPSPSPSVSTAIQQSTAYRVYILHDEIPSFRDRYRCFTVNWFAICEFGFDYVDSTPITSNCAPPLSLSETLISQSWAVQTV